MNKQGTRILGLIAALMVVLPGLAQLRQEENSECVKILREAYSAQMNTADKNGKIIQYSYTTHIDYNSDETPSFQDITSTVIAGENMLVYTNKLAELYRDKEEVVVVMHINKEVIRSLQGNLNLAQVDPTILNKAIDTLIASSALTDCSPVELDGKAGRRIRIKIREEWAERMQMTAITFWMTDDDQLIRRIRIEFPEKSEISMLTNSFFGVDRDVKMREKDAASYVFDKKGALLPKYKGYTIVDQRL